MKNIKDKVLKKALKNQKIRFIVVGCINTMVGYIAFISLVFLSLQYIVANLFATIIGVTTSYYLNKYYTFKRYKKSVEELFRFVLVYLISFVISNLILYALIDLLLISPYKAGSINIFFVTMISWFGHKYFSFKN